MSGKEVYQDELGEFMRVLRVRHHEVMGDVAKLLGVSTPFLSAVENGRKNVCKIVLTSSLSITLFLTMKSQI